METIKPFTFKFGKLVHLIIFFTLNEKDDERAFFWVNNINFDVFWSFMRIGHSSSFFVTLILIFPKQ